MNTIICSYCGSECSERDQATGRCGSCACFFHGNEEVIAQEESVAQPASEMPLTTDESPTGEPQRDETGTAGDTAGNPSQQPSHPPAVQQTPSTPELSSSEGLIQPRRLSPQFRRRVERTWESTYNGAGFTAESTLSAHSPSMDTHTESPTLSIATRKVFKSSDNGGASEGDYELKEVIGEGSMGRVWSARQTSLDRNVAVKVPKAELAGAGSVGEGQFISEVVVTGQLEHPNIVPIYELGRDASGVPFYSMKHVQGRPWNEFIDDHSDQDNIEILMKVCDAIAFAHDRNFLHRDIKPHNVMVGEFGEVSVMDWGIAVSITKDPDQPWASIATGPAGTPAYMAPEMAAHNPSELGVVSDIYLLGAVLYEMVTGTPPHPRTGDTGKALLAAAANEIIPTTRSGELIDIARRAMATDLNDRYQSVQELQDALREYQSHRESIQLSESADQHFANAMEQGSSDEFARARFAYEEALKLWEENAAATGGMRLATIAHAKNALEQENYELGIAILNADNPEHRELLSKLESERAARQRLAWFSKIAAGTAIVAVLLVIIGGTYALYVTNAQKTEANRAKVAAENASSIAEDERGKAKDAEAGAKIEAQNAKQAKDSAIAAQKEARHAEGTARQEKRRAKMATRRAQEAPYSSEMGLAAESIRRNLFGKAKLILDKLDPTKPDPDLIMSKLRHIEWGLLKYTSATPAVTHLRDDDRVEVVGSSVDGSTVAAGTEDGNLMLWSAIDWSNVDWILAPPQPKMIQLGIRISALAVSGDGRLIAASGTQDLVTSNESKSTAFNVSIWRVDENGFQHHLNLQDAHSREILSIAFSHDATRIVTSAADHTAVVWDVASGQQLFTMPDHSDRLVWCARFSPTNHDVVTACNDGRVRVWRISAKPDVDGRVPEAIKIRDFRGHDGPVYAATFSPDGGSVLSGGYDRRLLKWNLDAKGSGAENSNQRLVQSRLAGERIETARWKQVGSANEQHTASIRSIAVSAAGIVTGGNDNTVRVWLPTAESWDLDKILRGHGRWVKSCVFTNQGETVLSGAYDGMKLWTWNDYLVPRVLSPNPEGRLGKQPSELAASDATQAIYSRDRRWIATTYANGTVEVWDLQNPAETTGQMLVDGHKLLTTTGVFYNEGKRLLTSAGDNTTRLWNVKRGTHTLELTGTGYRGAADIAWNGQQSALVVTGSDDRMTPAWLWQIQDGKPPVKMPLLQNYALSRLPASLRQNPAGLRPTNALSLVSLRVRGFDQLRKLKRRIPDVTTVVFSNSGKSLVIGNSAGDCFVYEIDTNHLQPRLLASFPAHGSPVTCAAFLPTGDSFITASVDGQIRQWETVDGRLKRTFHWAGPVTAMAVSENGSELLVGHAPVSGRDLPIVQLLGIDGQQVTVKKQFSKRSIAGDRNWTVGTPTVQSVQFLPGREQAMISLFFPTQDRDRKTVDTNSSRLTGYQMAYWNWNDDDSDCTELRSSKFGEISSAVFRQSANGSQLLVVGGKGARLWSSEDEHNEQFTRLAKSFRPATKITSVDFSYNPTTKVSDRLVVGDSEGSIRVWQLDAGRWSESTQAATHLTGYHSGAVVSTFFHPSDPSRMLTADDSGQWRIWSFDGSQEQWTIRTQPDPNSVLPNCFFAMFSPDGKQVIAGTENDGVAWSLDDQGNCERDLTNWHPGKVRSAVITADGSWIVTSDGDRTVQFWDSKGNRLAKMKEGDAMGITGMAISKDRRRLVTAQDNRIVIWDTSRIIDPVSEDDQADQGGSTARERRRIKELLTVESERQVTSISISPDSRNLLSSESGGRTVIWSGEAITPISISFASDQIGYQTDWGAKKLCELAIVNDPSEIANFSQAQVTVKVVGQPIPAVELELRSTYEPLSTHSTESTIEVVGEVGNRVLNYRSHLGATAMRIGTLHQKSNKTSPLEITLNKAADAAAVQALLRAVTYRIDSPKSAISDLTSIDETSWESQIISISISKIHYDIDSKEQSVEEQIRIEVSSADEVEQISQDMQSESVQSAS